LLPKIIWSETAFYISEGKHYHIRWFTPTKEVDLCSHATLATAFVINLKGAFNTKEIAFNSKSGILKVEKSDDLYILDFPKIEVVKINQPSWVKACLGLEAEAVFQCGLNTLLVYKDEATISLIQLDLLELKSVETVCVVITAKGDHVDFVSRMFAPSVGIDEDPVTGSTHKALAPYWSEVLGKKKLTAKQVSKRGGTLHCEVLRNRVKISGKGKLYLKGTILLN